jgi:hypothetical protein
MRAAWNGWLWACPPILYSNQNLVGSYALPSAATIAPTSSISMSISLQEKVGSFTFSSPVINLYYLDN